jgi:hypothetical protein
VDHGRGFSFIAGGVHIFRFYKRRYIYSWVRCISGNSGLLFTFSANLDMFFNSGLSSWLTSFICLFFIFLPSFLLVIGTLPIWEELRKITLVIRSLKAINASVIGLLIAAWFYPIIL